MTTLMADSGRIAKRAGGNTPAAFSPSRLVAEIVALQHDRWILWLAPAMIAGAAAWLLWPCDPPAWVGPVGFATAAASAVALNAWPWRRQRFFSRAIAAGLALISAVCLGATAAQLRTGLLAHVTYDGGDAPVPLEGWVLANDPGETGPRLRILVRGIEGVAAPPRIVRVSVSDTGVLTPGRGARCRAVLGPPSGPLAPGGYDFARRAYFENLSATGFAFGRCRPALFEPPPRWIDRQVLALAAMRSDLSATIVAAAPGRGGALAAALVTGDRSPIDSDTNDALRDSGLGHLVSVSGIHMGVVGGLVFAALVWTLSLIAPIALRLPVKKIAALGALIALGLYLTISGTSVPALRAFVMACVAFGAILLDRPAISMRGLALAALLVTLLFPESVLEPGFQMSFAATMALVALFEILKRGPHEPALPTPGPVIGLLNWATRSLGAVLLISLVAGLATDPFALYHFQRFSLYALPANLIVAPIMSFLVAPAACAAAVLAPFGLADPALEFMASALDLVVAVGGVFGERPEAVRASPRPPDGAFLLCVGALLWACLWRGRLRWGGLLLLAASAALYAAAPRPLAAFDAELRALFVRGESGWMLLARPGRSTYARDRLGAMLGVGPIMAERLPLPQGCGDDLCLIDGDGEMKLAVVRNEPGFEGACVAGAIVLTRLKAPDNYRVRCGLVALMEGENLARQGGAMIYRAPDGFRIERSVRPATARPWTPRAAALQE